MAKIDRTRRVGSQIQQTLAKVINQDLSDWLGEPSLKFVTLTDVKVTKDMAYATVYISTIENNETSNGLAVASLDESKSYLRKALSRELNLRVTPQLEFKADEVIGHGAHIEALLKSVSKPDQ